MQLKTSEIICRNINDADVTVGDKLEAVETMFESKQPEYRMSKPALLQLAKFLFNYIVEHEISEIGSTKEIKGCPFCGGAGAVIRAPYAVYGYDFKKPFSVVCQNLECGASLGVYCETREEAIHKWNTRTIRRVRH